MKKKQEGPKALAVVGLILNVIILPGLGSIVGGRTNSGVIQLVMSIVGFVLTCTIIFAIIGIPLMIAAWIWALVTGIEMVSE